MDYKHGGNIYNLENKDKILDFSSNINPLGPPKALEKRLMKAWDLIEKYPDPDYTDIRKKLSDVYGISKDHFLIGNGGIQAIHNVIEFLSFNQALIIVPTFVEYEKALERFGKSFRYFFLKEENDFRFNIDALLSDNLSDIDLVILCSPNNPTGAYIKKQQMIRLVEALDQRDINILIDEAFIDFLPEEMSMINHVPQYNNMIITRSLTKFFAVPGIRLGFFATSNQALISETNLLRESWSVNTFAKELVLELFNDENYIEETKKFIVEEGNRLYNQLIDIKGLKIYPPSVNYIFFKSEEGILWKEELLKFDILIRHCSNYIGLDKEFYRIAVKTKKENDLLIKTMKEILEAYHE